MRPKKPLSTSRFSLRRPGSHSLSATTPFLTSAARARRASVERGREVPGDRLLRVDVLAGADGGAHRIRTHRGELRVEVDLEVGIGQAAGEVGAEVLDAVLFRDRAQLGFRAADEDRLGPDDLTGSDPQAALAPDRQDRPDQVLVHSHPAGHAVHHDADRAHPVRTLGGARSGLGLRRHCDSRTSW